MASIPRLRSTAGSSAEQVECLDELLTNILSRVATRDVLKMSTVRKRWRTLISDPGFVYTHYKNCNKESIYLLTHIVKQHQLPEQYQLRSYNYQTGNLSIVPFSWAGLDSYFRNGRFEVVTASNGLICFCPDDFPKYEFRALWLYNPVTKFSKKLQMPFEVYLYDVYIAEICYTQTTLKFVIAGLSLSDSHPYTLVFDSRLNSWYSGQPLPLLRCINIIHQYSSPGFQIFFNGVVYSVARVDRREAQKLEGFRDSEDLYVDVDDLLHMIIGYDVSQDQWGFSLFVPASVGFTFRLTEWEGNLLVCASDDDDGHFVFWILDTERKLWIREGELDLSHELHNSCEVSASGGVVWITTYNSVILYHMKNRHWSRHRLDDAFGLQQSRFISLATFEPTLLSF